MTSQAPRDPFEKTRGTKPWVVDRMIQPPSRRRLELATPRLIPRLPLQGIPVLPIVILLLACGTCSLVLRWGSATFGVVGSATDQATPSTTPRPTFTEVKGSPLTPFAPPTATVRVNATPSPLARPAFTPTPLSTAPPVKYIVKAGDTLLGIALKYGISVDALREANGLTGSMIHAGDELVIPPY